MIAAGGLLLIVCGVGLALLGHVLPGLAVALLGLGAVLLAMHRGMR